MRAEYYAKVTLTCVLVFILLGIAVAINNAKPKCLEAGCDNTPDSDSSYCFIHRPRNKSYSSKSSSAKTSGSTVKSYSSKSSSSSKKSTRSNSYDEGYDDIYLDEDYDSKRYLTDRDYASGVDDAMEDIDW